MAQRDALPVNEFIEAAREYQERGWRVTPLHRVGGRMRMCSCSAGANCKNKGKHPLWSDWPRRTDLLDDAEIEKLWGGRLPWNIGIITGTASGIWVVDVDPKNGGLESARRLRDVIGRLRARVIRTGGDGFHYYFEMPEGVDITNANKKLKADHPGIDVRGTGGLVVAPPSVSDKGPYRVDERGDREPGPASDALVELVRHVAPARPTAGLGSPGDQNRVERYARGIMSSIATELRALRDLKLGDVDAKGRGWEKATADAAQRLGQLVRADWNDVDADTALELLLSNAPTDDGWTTADVQLKWEQQHERGEPTPYPPSPPEPQSRDPFAPGYVGRPIEKPDPKSAPDVEGEPRGERESLRVDNPATMLDWLQANMGKGRLSGLYLRGLEVVHVPGEGEEGYRRISDNERDSDGPAQVRPLTPLALVGKIHFSYRTYVPVKTDSGQTYDKHALFPDRPASIALASPEQMHNLPLLRRVTHAPIVRADGSILSEPGYDAATGVLYRPDPGLVVPEVPLEPTPDDVGKARGLLFYMLQDFRFETPSDRLAYLGMMLTPLLRPFAPAPYKMCLIEASQPGSGKTFLARVLKTLHGGVFRSEMPRDEAEMNKVITAILDVTTSPVIIFDNATGVIRSSTLSGLLTSDRWEDRRLGTGNLVNASNDRLWVITGNNINVTGDLARRTLRARIDAGVPHPERRTNFAIPDFESWVRDNRGGLLWALLVLIRHWFRQGRPDGEPRGADVYNRWANTVDGILRAAGAKKGKFDDSVLVKSSDSEEMEWGHLLHAIYQVKHEEEWTARDILLMVNESSLAANWTSQPKPIPYEAIPSDLINKRRPNQPLDQLSKSFGWWLSNRAGRWAGWMDQQYKVVGQDTRLGKRWQIVRYVPTS